MLKKALLITLTVSTIGANPETTVFAFDLHHVLVKPDMVGRAKVLLLSQDKWTILQHILDPLFLVDLYRTFSLKATAYDLGMGRLYKKYPDLKKVDNTILDLANAQKPRPQLISLIQKLKAQGYKVYMLSNIGETMFAKFKDTFGDIVSLFDGCAICERLNGYMQKPSVGMYKNFRAKFALNDKQIIFVDDLLENIYGAQIAGFNAIHFKSSGDLLKRLEDLSIIDP